MDECDLLGILSDKTILYAEDEPGIRRNITEILELFFMNVIAVEDGQAVLDEMAISHYDVLMLDIVMPRIDGLKAVQIIRKTNQNIPIIIVSAHSTQKYLLRAVELKITKYLTKPITKEHLITALEHAALELIRHKHHPIKLDVNRYYSPYRKCVYTNEQSQTLTPTESRLFEYLITQENCTVSFEAIADYLWRYEPRSKETIKSLIKDLRKKVGSERIQNVYGVGYFFLPFSVE